MKERLEALLEEIEKRRNAAGRSPEGRQLSILATDIEKAAAFAAYHGI